jgi:hypothetical protein
MSGSVLHCHTAAWRAPRTPKRSRQARFLRSTGLLRHVSARWLTAPLQHSASMARRSASFVNADCKNDIAILRADGPSVALFGHQVAIRKGRGVYRYFPLVGLQVRAEGNERNRQQSTDCMTTRLRSSLPPIRAGNPGVRDEYKRQGRPSNSIRCGGRGNWQHLRERQLCDQGCARSQLIQTACSVGILCRNARIGPIDRGFDRTVRQRAVVAIRDKVAALPAADLVLRRISDDDTKRRGGRVHFFRTRGCFG